MPAARSDSAARANTAARSGTAARSRTAARSGTAPASSPSPTTDPNAARAHVENEAEVADGWLVVEDAFDPAMQRGQETVFTVGNGLLGTRGSLEERYPGDRPGTLVHGMFDEHPLARSELANAPDWTDFQVIVEGEAVSLDRGEILAHRRVLDLRSGLLTRRLRWRSPAGPTIELLFERFASLADPHLLCQRLTVTPQDFEGLIEVRAGLDGCPATEGRLHWDVLGSGAEDARAWLELRTREGSHRLGMAMHLTGGGRGATSQAWDRQGHPAVAIAWQAQPGAAARIEKVVAVATSREGVEPGMAARARLAAASAVDGGFDTLHAANAAAWAAEWDVADVEIEGDPAAQLAVRFSLYQLLIAAPRGDERTSIGAKALTGPGYHGHVFWDTEIFMLPFFSHVRPTLARDLLSYRWHLLDGARRKAAAAGLAGARYPWESDGSGDEVAPTWLPDSADPTHLTRIWTGDIELHVTADIAFAVCQYWRASADERFMLERGAEIVLETARFWASRVEWEASGAEAEGCFHLRDVIGPDEYHEHVDDNAYTNVMAAWNLRAAARLGRWLRAEHPDEAERLLAADAEPDAWERIAGLIHLPVDAETGLIEQFEGYLRLRDVSLASLGPRSRSAQAILGFEATNATQLIKQPDVLMLALLLPERFERPELAAADAYYTPRTDHQHGSSLGPAIQAVVASRLGRTEEAYDHFMRAAGADLLDVRGNAGDGIHAASIGGIWQALVFGFGGLRLAGDPAMGPEAGGWRLEPRLPAHWSRLRFRFHHAGRLETVELRQTGERSTEAATPRPVSATQVRGLLFDLDGVLTDTAEHHYLAWQRLADEVGVPFDRGAAEALRGVSRRDSLARVLDGREVGEDQAEALMARKNDLYLEAIRRISPEDVLPGVRALLTAARAAGLRIAIASTSRNAAEVVERLGLRGEVDVLCDGRTVERGKPAPDLFLEAAARLGLPPRECLVFEDAAAGIEAARAAGMQSVGIGPISRVGAADLVLGGFDGITLEAIQAGLARQSAAGGETGEDEPAA